MMKRVLAVAVCVCLSSALVATFAQEAPKPGPEHKKLGYFVGKWSAEGETKENPFMPSGKFTTKDSCEWFEGGFSVVCKSEGSGPMGPMKGIGLMSYSPDAKAYTYYGVDNGPMAMVSVPLGKIDGDTWTYHDEMEMEGKTVKSRYVMKILSPTSYTFKWEIEGEDGGWQTVMEGKSTKKS